MERISPKNKTFPLASIGSTATIIYSAPGDVFPGNNRDDTGAFAVGIRRIRRTQRRVEMAESRRVNGHVKEKERARREARLMAVLRSGKLPFIPAVMSWLSVKLDKRSSKIVQADIDTLLAHPARGRLHSQTTEMAPRLNGYGKNGPVVADDPVVPRTCDQSDDPSRDSSSRNPRIDPMKPLHEQGWKHMTPTERLENAQAAIAALNYDERARQEDRIMLELRAKHPKQTIAFIDDWNGKTLNRRVVAVGKSQVEVMRQIASLPDAERRLVSTRYLDAIENPSPFVPLGFPR